MRLKETLFTLLAITIAVGLGYLLQMQTGIKTRPDISLMTVDGQELQLAEFNGKPLLVTFWSTSCPVCIKEMPHLIELYNELSPRGLEIIAIAMNYDPPNRVLAMRKSRNIPYPVALDINASAARAFGNVQLTPTTFLIAPDGRVVYRKIGFLHMAELRQDILEMLESIQSGLRTPAYSHS